MPPQGRNKDLIVDTACVVANHNHESGQPDHDGCTMLSFGQIKLSSALSSPMTPTPGDAEDSAWLVSAHNPHNWSACRKWTTTMILSGFTFNTLVTSTMVIPALTQITIDLGISSDATTQIVLSIFPLAYICGFILWAPLSEVYGRALVLQMAGMWFVIWNLASGFAPNQTMMIIGRLFSGTGAAAALAISPGVLGDVLPAERRGCSLAILSIIGLTGLTVGGILGGVVAARGHQTWRMAFWSTSTCSAILQLLALFTLRESHAPTIKRNLRSRSKEAAVDRLARSKVTAKALRIAMRRPFHLFVRQRILQLLTLYTGVSFGILYFVMSTISDAFQSLYSQSILTSSINFLSIGIGMTIGAQLCAPITDYLYRRDVRRRREIVHDSEKGRPCSMKPYQRFTPSPEIRLVPFIPAVLITAAGLSIYGWTLQARTHWIGPNVGIVLLGVGNQAMTQCTNAYVIDSFSQVKERQSTIELGQEADMTLNLSASAMCAVWAAKSIGGFAFPLAAPRMIEVLCWGKTFSILAGCTMATGVPIGGLLMWKGGRWREQGEKRL